MVSFVCLVPFQELPADMREQQVEILQAKLKPMFTGNQKPVASKKIILVGDPCQLPPTVLSKVSKGSSV